MKCPIRFASAEVILCSSDRTSIRAPSAQPTSPFTLKIQHIIDVAEWPSSYHVILLYGTHNHIPSRRPFQARLNPQNGLHIILRYNIPIDKFPLRKYMCGGNAVLTFTVTGSGWHGGTIFRAASMTFPAHKHKTSYSCISYACEIFTHEHVCLCVRL